MNNIPENRIVWIDLEMTGLDTTQDKILEIATVVTEADLTVVAEGPVFAIHQDDAVLGAMDDWNTRQHKKSGLVERVRLSTITEEIAEKETLAFLHKHVLPGKSPMAGNSVCQDRRFMFKFMPKLESFFHYRHLDVTTLKILANYWRPSIVSSTKKKIAHLALQDVYDSIDELRYYREHFIRLSDESASDKPTSDQSDKSDK